ncbi:MAG: hypothetical protein ACKO3T_21810, partial [Planctomycetaceae bacterium]
TDSLTNTAPAVNRSGRCRAGMRRTTNADYRSAAETSAVVDSAVSYHPAGSQRNLPRPQEWLFFLPFEVMLQGRETTTRKT